MLTACHNQCRGARYTAIDRAQKRRSVEGPEQLREGETLAVTARDQLPVPLDDPADVAVVEAIHSHQGFESLPEPALTEALSDLHQQGFTVERQAGGSRFGARLDPIAAYYYVHGHNSQRVTLRPPQSMEHIAINQPDDLAALNYFRGSGRNLKLAMPEVAQGLRERCQEGFSFGLRQADQQSDAYGIYRGLRRAPAERLWVHRDQDLVPADAGLLSQPAELEARLTEARQALTHLPAEAPKADFLETVYYGGYHQPALVTAQAVGQLLDSGLELDAARQVYQRLLDLSPEPLPGVPAFTAMAPVMDQQQAIELMGLVYLPVGKESLQERAELMAGLKTSDQSRVRDYIDAAAHKYAADPDEAIHRLTVRWMLKGEVPVETEARPITIEDENDESLWIGDVHLAREGG